VIVEPADYVPARLLPCPCLCYPPARCCLLPGCIRLHLHRLRTATALPAVPLRWLCGCYTLLDLLLTFYVYERSYRFCRRWLRYRFCVCVRTYTRCRVCVAFAYVARTCGLRCVYRTYTPLQLLPVCLILVYYHHHAPRIAITPRPFTPLLHTRYRLQLDYTRCRLPFYSDSRSVGSTVTDGA